MKTDARQLQTWFEMFNGKYFNGELPQPSLCTGMSRTRLGSMSWRTERRLFSSAPRDYSIRISNYFEAGEHKLKSVLLHEMIHLYIVSRRLEDSSPHGIVFRKMMDEINKDGWDIRVSEKMTVKDTAPHAVKKRERIVLSVTTKDGKHILSVVNRAYVSGINSLLKKSSSVKEFSWHISRDGYFASFPVVRTPRGRLVGNEEYAKVMALLAKETPAMKTGASGIDLF